MIQPLIVLGKSFSGLSRLLGKGNGSTWPGEIALRISPGILKTLLPIVHKKIVLVAGTNGKTTTAKMLVHILQHSPASSADRQPKIVSNPSGANLLNGLVSAFFTATDWWGQLETDYAVLEVDEGTLPLVIQQMDWKKIPAEKVTIVLLNLFRDQLDRYGEVDSIAGKWKGYIKSLPAGVQLILNADDPQIASLGRHTSATVTYFGIDRPNEYMDREEHATDSVYCPECGTRLHYTGIYFSHVGIWSCPSCGFRRPNPHVHNLSSPLAGLYNEYNSLSACSAALSAGIPIAESVGALKNFSPAFGRQEEIQVGTKTIKIFLSKNPAGFNASLRAVLGLHPKTLVLSLNDRIPDGRDVSWIWDVDFEIIPEDIRLIATGDRAYDMGVRLKYTGESPDYTGRLSICENPAEAIKKGLAKISDGNTLYILATYSAMLEIRKIIKGRKIL